MSYSLWQELEQPGQPESVLSQVQVLRGLLRLKKRLQALLWARKRSGFCSHAQTVLHPPTFDIMQTINPFSSILYDPTVFKSCKILPVYSAQDEHDLTWTLTGKTSLCLPLSMHT